MLWKPGLGAYGAVAHGVLMRRLAAARQTAARHSMACVGVSSHSQHSFTGHGGRLQKVACRVSPDILLHSPARGTVSGDGEVVSVSDGVTHLAAAHPGGGGGTAQSRSGEISESQRGTSCTSSAAHPSHHQGMERLTKHAQETASAEGSSECDGEFIELSSEEAERLERNFKRSVLKRCFLSTAEREHLTRLIYDAFYRKESRHAEDPAMLYQARLELTWIEEWADALPEKPYSQGTATEGHTPWRDDAVVRQSIKRAVLERVDLRKPLSYILGAQPFLGCSILCRPPLLCPRSETEMWVHWLIRSLVQHASTEKRSLEVLDMCCGTGCIGVAIAKHVAYARVHAVDILPEAVQLSLENATRNGIPAKRYAATHSDMFACFATAQHEAGAAPTSAPTINTSRSNLQIAEAYRHSLDLIVCNPPYVFPAQYLTLPRSITHWETKLALVGDAYRESRQHLYFQELCDYGAALLKPKRRRDPALLQCPNFVVEVGLQAELVASLMERSGMWEDVQVHLDYAQQPRWISASSVH